MILPEACDGSRTAARIQDGRVFLRSPPRDYTRWFGRLKGLKTAAWTATRCPESSRGSRLPFARSRYGSCSADV